MNTIMNWVALFSGVLAFILIECSYLYFTRDIFKRQIESVQRGSRLIMRASGAIACYVLLFIAIYFFIWRLRRPAWEAALLGAVIYGVYETTSLAILSAWKWKTVVQDTLYGAFLFFASTVVYNQQLSGGLYRLSKS